MKDRVAMNKKDDDQIQKKLIELEATIVEEPPQQLVVASPKTTNLVAGDEEVKSDLYLTVGAGLLLLGIFLLFNHVRVGTGFLTWLGVGGQGFGLILIPLLVGIGFLCYDYKNRIGWVVTAVSLAAIIFGMLSHLVMTFPAMSLLGVIIMLLPFAFGGALVVRAIQSKKTISK